MAHISIVLFSTRFSDRPSLSLCLILRLHSVPMRCSDKHHTDPSAEPVIWKENLPAELIADAQSLRFKKKFAERRSKIVYEACERVHVGSMMSRVKGERVFLGAGHPLVPPAKLQLSTLCASSQSLCSRSVQDSFATTFRISPRHSGENEKEKTTREHKNPFRSLNLQLGLFLDLFINLSSFCGRSDSS